MSSQQRATIPPEQWVVHPPNDWADYADKMPLYGSDLTGEAKAEFEAASAEREKKPEPTASKPKRRRPRRRKKQP